MNLEDMQNEIDELFQLVVEHQKKISTLITAVATLIKQNESIAKINQQA